MDKIKAGADDATAKARATVQDVQAKRELSQAYGELGRVAYELIQDGSLSDERLRPAAEHVRQVLESRPDEAA